MRQNIYVCVVAISVAIVLITSSGIDAVPGAQRNLGQQIAYQNKMMQQQIASNINQMANRANYQQAQMAQAVNNMARQATGR